MAPDGITNYSHQALPQCSPVSSSSSLHCAHILRCSFSFISLPLSCSTQWNPGSLSVWDHLRSAVPCLYIMVPVKGHLGHEFPAWSLWYLSGHHLRLAPHQGPPEGPHAGVIYLRLTCSWNPYPKGGSSSLQLTPHLGSSATLVWSSQASSLSGPPVLDWCCLKLMFVREC